MEDCQILQSREAVQLCAIATRFLTSGSLDPVLWTSTPRYGERLDDFSIDPAADTRKPGGRRLYGT